MYVCLSSVHVDHTSIRQLEYYCPSLLYYRKIKTYCTYSFNKQDVDYFREGMQRTWKANNCNVLQL